MDLNMLMSNIYVPGCTTTKIILIFLQKIILILIFINSIYSCQKHKFHLFLFLFLTHEFYSNDHVATGHTFSFISHKDKLIKC